MWPRKAAGAFGKLLPRELCAIGMGLRMEVQSKVFEEHFQERIAIAS